MMQNLESCPVRKVLSTVTGKWQILILSELSSNPLRFGALKTKVGGISQRVLTEKLRSMERDGYLTRTVDPGPPIAVTYQLTERGHQLFERLAPLIHWATNHLPAVENSRAEYDERNSKRSPKTK